MVEMGKPVSSVFAVLLSAYWYLPVTLRTQVRAAERHS